MVSEDERAGNDFLTILTILNDFNEFNDFIMILNDFNDFNDSEPRGGFCNDFERVYNEF